ncbi:MAG: hypothetical protein ACUVWR_08675 [Anaerolineae bacterium]
MSAVPAREEARRLLELVPDEDMGMVARMLRGLIISRETDPFLLTLQNAPEDDEPVSEEEEAVQLSEEEEARGELISDADLWRELGDAPQC